MSKRKTYLCIGLLALFTVLCSGCQSEFGGSADEACLEKMEQDILALAGEPLCSDSTECRYIGFGSKPCGGPWRYLVYSISTVDTVELVKRVEEYNEYERCLNRRYGRVSDCSVPIPPRLGCRNGRCVDLQ
ncbi:MAG: hypothetical protein ABIJ00_10480 [Candidatus Eisenbacteria bacterium]